jgi:hypothetical protein
MADCRKATWFARISIGKIKLKERASPWFGERQFRYWVLVCSEGWLSHFCHGGAIASIERPNPSSFPGALVAKGQVLAAEGHCVSCPTRAGGPT